MAPLSALIAGGLATLVGFHDAVWIGTLIGLTAPIFVWWLRHLKDMPAADPGTSDAGPARARRDKTLSTDASETAICVTVWPPRQPR